MRCLHIVIRQVSCLMLQCSTLLASFVLLLLLSQVFPPKAGVFLGQQSENNCFTAHNARERRGLTIQARICTVQYASCLLYVHVRCMCTAKGRPTQFNLCCTKPSNLTESTYFARMLLISIILPQHIIIALHMYEQWNAYFFCAPWRWTCEAGACLRCVFIQYVFESMFGMRGAASVQSSRSITFVPTPTTESLRPLRTWRIRIIDRTIPVSGVDRNA